MNLKCDEPLSKLAFNFNLRHCTMGAVAAAHFSFVLGMSTSLKAVLASVGGAATFAGFAAVGAGGVWLLAARQWPALVPEAAGVPLEHVHGMLHASAHADPAAAAAADGTPRYSPAQPPRASGL